MENFNFEPKLSFTFNTKTFVFHSVRVHISIEQKNVFTFYTKIFHKDIIYFCSLRPIPYSFLRAIERCTAKKKMRKRYFFLRNKISLSLQRDYLQKFSFLFLLLVNQLKGNTFLENKKSPTVKMLFTPFFANFVFFSSSTLLKNQCTIFFYYSMNLNFRVIRTTILCNFFCSNFLHFFLLCMIQWKIKIKNF